MSLVNKLSEIKIGDLIVLDREVVGFVTDYTSQEINLALEDPKLVSEFYRKGNVFQQLFRRALFAPMGSLNIISETYDLRGCSQYQKLTPNEISGAFENLVDRLSQVKTGDIILISNPQLRVVGFVEDRSSNHVTLKQLSGQGSGLYPDLKYDLRNFNNYEVLRKRFS